MSLLVVGSLAFDSVETPFGRHDEVLGGSASFLSTAASFFTPVHMVGVVGEDFPAEHVDFFRSRDIDTRGLRVLPGKTFRWKGHYDHNLNVAHTLETHLNVMEEFRPELPDSFQDADFVVLGNIDPELQLRVLEQVRRPKLVAADSMNFWIESRNAKLRQMLSRIDLLCINDGEARQLSDEFNLMKAARKIRSWGPKMLVVKRGEYGALLFTDDGVFAAPAYPLEALQDPTGAGDSFAGGLMGWLSRHGQTDRDTVRQGVIMGSVLASFAVEKFSIDRLRTLTLDEIRLRFDEFKHLTHFEAAGEGLWDGA